MTSVQNILPSRRSFLAASAAAGSLALAAQSIGKARAAAAGTVVLVHGAFADGSSWHKVIPLVEAGGYNVIAVHLPLTSLADDVAATKRAIDRSVGPVTLVGHSWGGTVITEAGASDKVTSLVYVAAFANDAGTSVADLTSGHPGAPGGASVVVDEDGFAWVSGAGIARDFAPDVPSAEQRLVAATQGPINSHAFADKVSVAAWATKPSWYIVAQDDRMILPSLEEAMARKIGADTFRVPSSHVVMLSHPAAVARIILAAAQGE